MLETAPLIKGVVEDLRSDRDQGVISTRFHNTVIAMLHQICISIHSETGMSRVALSGGAFQNETLLLITFTVGSLLGKEHWPLMNLRTPRLA